ncbi:unnamed protein product [Protopolystoma xenopodis]|uniref:G-protein coupled receptors family 1 profile domain-containing protein n=1 Tax=Protopolystoma xenopodis TaxID=117903 RepID=A0A448XG44_9PLAT|nr:unnamed protein product [Protopolystoma xenopodis]
MRRPRMADSTDPNVATFNNTYWEILYNLVADYYLCWYLPLNIGVGLLGNLFCLIFLSRSKMFPKKVRIWMLCICTGDSLILLTDALRMYIKIATKWDMRDVNTPICRLHNFLSNYAFYWSAFMQTGLSLQRLYFVISPLSARIHLPLSKVVAIWFLLTFLPIFPNLIFLLFWHIGQDCEPYDASYYKVTSICDLVIQGILPLAAMVLSTVMIAARMHQECETATQRLNAAGAKKVAPLEPVPPIDARSSSAGGMNGAQFGSSLRSRTSLINNSLSIKEPSEYSVATGQRSYVSVDVGAGSHLPEQTQVGAKAASRRDNQSLRITRLLITLNVFYLITTFPLFVYLAYLNMWHRVGATIPQPLHRTIYYVLRSICFLNSSCNWIFYCIGGQVFRKHTRKLVCRFVFRIQVTCHQVCRHCCLGDTSLAGADGVTPISFSPLPDVSSEAERDRLSDESRKPTKAGRVAAEPRHNLLIDRRVAEAEDANLATSREEERSEDAVNETEARGVKLLKRQTFSSFKDPKVTKRLSTLSWRETNSMNRLTDQHANEQTIQRQEGRRREVGRPKVTCDYEPGVRGDLPGSVSAVETRLSQFLFRISVLEHD